jgi:hypothetical protein
MSNLIPAKNNASIRNEFLEGIALALRSLANKKEINDEAKDIISFIIIMLGQITKSIEITTTAWEKRDYWVKADHFRMDWSWSTVIGDELSKGLIKNDWDAIVKNLHQLFKRCGRVNIRKKVLKSKPWVGAFKQLSKELQ